MCRVSLLHIQRFIQGTLTHKESSYTVPQTRKMFRAVRAGEEFGPRVPPYVRNQFATRTLLLLQTELNRMSRARTHTRNAHARTHSMHKFNGTQQSPKRAYSHTRALTDKCALSHGHRCKNSATVGGGGDIPTPLRHRTAETDSSPREAHLS